MNPLLPLLTAFVTGFTHALAPDHVAAVSTFVSRRPSPSECLRFGARWGLGHSASVMLAGGVLIAMGLRIPEPVAQNLERAVGVMLCGLGLWLLWSLAHEVAHARAPHLHAEDVAAEEATGAEGAAGLPHHADHHRDRGGSFLVGMAHGLAGTAPLIGVIPVAFIGPREAAFAYLGVFSAGTIIAMALFAGAAGLVLNATGRASPALGLTLRFGTGLGSVVIGAFWITAA